MDKSYGFNTAKKVHELVGRPSYSGIRQLNFGLGLHLLPHFVCANSEGSGETAQ